MSGRFLPRRLPLVLVRLGRRFPRTVIIGALLSWLVAGFLASRVTVETDILSLVPQENPVVAAFKSTIERFGTVDTLLVVLRLGPEEDRESDLAFADQLAENLEEWELIEWVEYRLDNSLELVEPLLDRALLFMEPEEVERILAETDDEGLAERARRIRADLLTPQGIVAKDLGRLDPFGLLPILASRMKSRGIGAPVDPDSGVMIDSGGRMLLMLARPIRPAQDLLFNRELVSGLEARVEMVERQWREEAWEGEPPAVEFTGGYVVTLDDSELIISDAVMGIGSSLIGVLFLFLIAFRRRAALVYAFLIITTGLSLTFVFGAMTLGRMNSLTSAFGGLLVGLGIDFIIVLYGRYVEERDAGRTHEEAVDAMGRHTGVGVLLGAVTTAATFYAFLFTDFRGLGELGLLTGTGILLLVTTVYLLLPALLTKLQDRRKGRARHVIHAFGAEQLCAAGLRRPRIVVVAVIVVTGLLGWSALGLQFDDDIQNLRSPDNEGMKLRTEVMEAFGLRFTPMTIRVDAGSEAEALAVAQRLVPELHALVDGQNLAAVDTIVDLIPTTSTQRSVIELLEQEGSFEKNIGRRFAGALRKEGLNPTAFQGGIDHFEQALTVRESLSLGDFEGTVLETVVGRYLALFNGGVSLAIRCYPPAGRWRREAPPALEALVNSHPEVVLTGTNVVSAELRRIVWRDAFRASLIGIVLVFLLLWADLGSPGRSLLALTPLGIGLVWMLGAMSLFGLEVNFMNIFVATMVIGIGVDYSVHLLHRWFESGGRPEAVARTAKAIAVASLTTMVGFGSLVLSHYPGLRSVGAAAVLGALATAVLSITVLPVILQRLHYGGRENGS
ncbi:MAG: MMPL family transporter [Thermoanaerobaculales bacterium]|nr:MMPL family transporter [Thermoanaerobaculales bacterium]